MEKELSADVWNQLTFKERWDIYLRVRDIVEPPHDRRTHAFTDCTVADGSVSDPTATSGYTPPSLDVCRKCGVMMPCFAHYPNITTTNSPSPDPIVMRYNVSMTGQESGQFSTAIRQFLNWGEDAFKRGEQGGYFSGGGWAAAKLRELLRRMEQVENDYYGVKP